MECDFTQQGDYCVCTRPECQRKLKKSIHPCDKHHAQCKINGPQEEPIGLGDNMKRWLRSWGITKERYVEVKEMFGLPPTCNCDERQQWLNKIGAHFGIATDKYGPNKGEDNGT